jgi:arsenate reductase
MSLTVYGIKNCNTVKSALTWLKDTKINFEFHDFKSKGITAGKLKEWCSQVGWEELVNKRGTTWRQLPPHVQSSVKTQSAAVALMAEKTSVIKRPVIESGNQIITLGFDVAAFQSKLTVFR